MVDEKVRLIMGSLLHDTGKVIYRQGDDSANCLLFISVEKTPTSVSGE